MSKNTSPVLSSEEPPTVSDDSTITTTTIREDFVLAAPDKFKDDEPAEESNVSNQDLPQIMNLNCLLLADTTLECAPLHLQHVLRHFENASRIAPGELLFVLTYIIALESGFVAQKHYEEMGSRLHWISSTTSYHSKNVLRLSRLAPNYESNEEQTRFYLKLSSITDMNVTSTDQISALLAAFVTGDFLIVTLSPATSTTAKGYSVALSIGRFVLSMSIKNKPIYQRLKKLDELTNLLREQLFVPMRNQHLYWLSAPIYPSLDAMPPELYDNILQYLSFNQLKILVNVNKSLYNSTINSKHMIKMRA
ncbi:protein nutcracker isoform X1 [Musca domestica]|uniref:Protein nutcracker isoform X1 n=2 Tax=Musca domestica TaxID=7370 RepID=A0A9J7CUM9_MUSDO|nr:protein nutcracker isoform X1 [Musca domestica]